MKKEEAIEIARYIFTTGKLIHDRMYAAGSHYFGEAADEKTGVELSLPQMNLMFAVRRMGSVTMSDLAARLGVSPPSVSTMVERLVEKKILSREHSREDRRKVVVRISDDAVAVMDGFEGNMLDMFITLVEKIGPDTARKWCQVLQEVESVLEEK